MLSALDLLIIATAVPAITSDLGNLSQTSWIFTAYLLGNAVSMPIWGKLGDIYGRARIFVLAIILFVAASVVAGASLTMLMLIAGRLIQGIAAGGLLSVSHGIIGDIVPARDRSVYFASLTSVWASAAVLGPLLGGGFVDTVGWRWIFYMNLPLGAVAFFMILNYLRYSQITPVKRDVDYKGAGLLVVGLGFITLATSLVGDVIEPLSVQFLGAIAIGFGVLAVFVRFEMRTQEPMVPMSMFRYRVALAGSATNFFFGLGNFGVAIIIPLYAQIVNGVSATLAGLTLAPVALGVFFATLIVGMLIRRYGHYQIYPPLGCGFYIVGLFLLMSMTEDTSRPMAMLFALITGLGNGMLHPVIVTSIQNAIPPRDLGAATSLATSSRSLGQTVGSAILGAIITSRLTSRLTGLGLDPDEYLNSPEEIQDLQTTDPALSESVISSYHSALDYAFFGMFCFVLVALIISLFIPQEKLAAAPKSDP